MGPFASMNADLRRRAFLGRGMAGFGLLAVTWLTWALDSSRAAESRA